MKSMKKVLSLTLLLFVINYTIFSQTVSPYVPISDCSNHNAFLASPSIDTLKKYTNTIYPGGIMNLNLNKSDEYGSVDFFYPLLGVEQGSTFELVKTTASTFNNDKIYRKYQHYFNGIKVEGSGFTVGAYATSIASNPCSDILFMISPAISNGINIITDPIIKKNNLDSIIPGMISTSPVELLISPNLTNQCDYHLTWKVEHFDQKNKYSWVDAHTGAVLKTIDAHMNLNAPTEIYGQQTLNDDPVSTPGTTFLRSPNGDVRVYDISNDPCGLSTPESVMNSTIPSTTQSSWTTSVVPASFYQAFYVTSSILPLFEDIDIDFGIVNVGVDCSEENAVSLAGSTLEDAYIAIGGNSTNSFATFDVIAHELGHTFLNGYLDYTNIGNASLHEGICDMFGTYIESMQQGSIDWVIGDDLPVLAALVDRDLENPLFTCFTDASANATTQHERSTPLGHWFYLISEGQEYDATHELIVGLGIERSIRIVKEALNFMSANDDYPQMRVGVIAFVDAEFGPCSQESLTIRKAWNQICVGPQNYTNCFSITGLPYICEESNWLYFGLLNAPANNVYRWYFPSGWIVQGAIGNTYEGPTLSVSGFPTYSYYPRYFTIKVYSPSLGPEYTKFFTVKLMDCDGDDPSPPPPPMPCGSYSSFMVTGTSPTTPLELGKMDDFKKEIETARTVKVYDITGRVVYTGSIADFKRNSTRNIGVLFIQYFSEEGMLLRVEKVLSTSIN